MIIPDRWYAIEESRRLRRRPRALTRMGRRLVLWRRADGAPVAMEDRCPHRGAALHRGRVHGDEIACPYHGFRFDAAGRCTRMPCEGSAARTPRGMEVGTFPLREAHGLLWLWWGTPRADYPSIPWFHELDGSAGSAGSAVEWDVPHERLIESHFDLHHFPFLHRSTGGFAVGPRLDPYEVEEGGDWIRTRGTLRREDQDPARGFAFRVEFQAPNLVLFELSKRIRFIAVTTPVDEARSWLYARYYQDYVALPGLRSVLAWLALELDWKVFQNLQDLPVLRSLEPSHADRHAYRLVRADAGSAAYLKLRERLLQGDEPRAPVHAVST
jgi:phenylpropionate dioxygenase-like ring-hydroxylating dioxygenase large terminal subunit